MNVSDIWLTSDHHFSHVNILKFTGVDGKTLIRPEFDGDVAEMDAYMIDQWNSVVKPNDKVYHLGDVAFNDGLHWVKHLRGNKHLVLGNHDKFQIEKYHQVGFQKIRASMKYEKSLALTHFPIHQGSIPKDRINVHGHIHERPSPKGPYFNVSVERNAYKPFHLDEILKWRDSYLAGLEFDSFLRETGGS